MVLGRREARQPGRERNETWSLGLGSDALRR
jgi:hypothetical protein